MFSKKIAVLTALATMVGAFLVFGPMQGDQAFGGGEAITFGGSWLMAAPTLGVKMLETLVPMDHFNKRFVVQAQNLTPNYTFNGLFPADYLSQFNGEAVKIGPSTLEATMIAYSIKKATLVAQDFRDTIVLIWVLHATSKFTEDIQVFTGDAAVYLASADADGDLIPDEGAVPIVCIGPLEGTATRVPMMDPCGP